MQASRVVLATWVMLVSAHTPEPEAYRRDVPTAEVHVLGAGHSALDTAADEIAGLVLDFMARGQHAHPAGVEHHARTHQR